MASRKNIRNRTLRFQFLEDRQLMAGNLISKLPPGTTIVKLLTPDVTTSVSSKHVLSITGNGASDAITITQTAPKEFTVTGVDGTTIDKTHTSMTFKGITSDVDVTFNGGAGTTASLTVGTGSPITFPNNLNVNMGNGSNTFSMTNAVVERAMTLTGGSSHDYAFIADSKIGNTPARITNTNDLNINLGGGVNGLVMEKVTVQRDLTISDEASTQDQIYLADGINVGRNLSLATGSGADSVAVAGVNVKGEMSIYTGAGNDSLYLGGLDDNGIEPVYADLVYVNLGAGDDYMKTGDRLQGGVFGTTNTSFGSYDGGTGTNTWDNATGGGIDGSISDFEVVEYNV
jgi:hypothetical protein